MYAFSNERTQEWPTPGPVLSAFDPIGLSISPSQLPYLRSDLSSASHSRQHLPNWLQCAPQCAPYCNIQPALMQTPLQHLPYELPHPDNPQWQSPQNRVPRGLHSMHATATPQLYRAMTHTVPQRFMQGTADYSQRRSRSHFSTEVVPLEQGFAHNQLADFEQFANVSRQLDLAIDDSCLQSDMTLPFELMRGVSVSPPGPMSMMRLPVSAEPRGCSQLPSQCNTPQAEIKPETESDLLLDCNSEKYSDVTPAEIQSSITKLPELAASSSPERDASNSDELSGTDRPAKHAGRKKTKIDHITVEYLEKHKCFDMPLAEAAKSLDVGLSVMKRVCRTLGLARWPYRTRQSLRSVIHKTEQYLVTDDETAEGEASSGQKAHVIEALQSQMSAVTGRGGSDLNAAIKKYRQSIFKLNYKLKKSKSSPSARHKIAVPLNAAERILADQA